MTFRNPALALPGLPLIGQGYEINDLGNLSLQTPVLSVVGVPSLLIAGIPTIGAPLIFNQISVGWYADAEQANLLVAELHWVLAPVAGKLDSRVPMLLTESKGPYVVVQLSTPAAFGTLDVFASATPVVGYQRLDESNIVSVNYGLVVQTHIPASQLVTHDVGYGFAKNSQLVVVSQITGQVGNTGALPNFTPSYAVKAPNGLVIASAAAAPIAAPAAGVTVNTVPVALPAIPGGGLPFEVDLTLTLSAALATQQYDVNTYVYCTDIA